MSFRGRVRSFPVRLMFPGMFRFLRVDVTLSSFFVSFGVYGLLSYGVAMRLGLMPFCDGRAVDSLRAADNDGCKDELEFAARFLCAPLVLSQVFLFFCFMLFPLWLFGDVAVLTISQTVKIENQDSGARRIG